MPVESPAAGRGRGQAIAQALLVTFLWSSSWVLIKVGLQTSLPPLTFAGLRYSLAFLALLPFVLFNPRHRQSLAATPRSFWRQLALLGVLFYTLTQGAQFVGLALLPAATLTLLLNFSVVAVALFSGLFNHESPTAAQWGGILLSVVGAVVYFLPLVLPADQALGLIVGLICVLANAAASLLGRQVNRAGRLSPLLVTTVSMGIGGLLLLAIGAATQGFGELGTQQWAIIAWLAVVNTAVAFTLWNRTQRTLTAVESSVINNTMLPQIAILAWVFLDEPLSLKQIAGLVLVGMGTLIVQLRRTSPAASVVPMELSEAGND
jgi:drug/metabolite transporter (DMT)-like permease